MGPLYSSNRSRKLTPEEVRGVVLVPPLFERDFRGRSRMTRSAYDWMFCKPGLKWLFNDYIRNGEAYSIVRLRPSEDARLSVHTRLLADIPKYGKNTYDADGIVMRGAYLPGESFDRSFIVSIGRMALRFQPDVEEPLTFVDIKAGTQNAAPVVRGCFFDAEKGYGFFAAIPLMRKQIGDNSPDLSVGLRHSSPQGSVGIIATPLTQQISKAWAVTKSGPFCMGLQFVPKRSELNLPEPSNLGDIFDRAAQSTSFALSYSPDGSASSPGKFTTAIELRESSQLSLSLLYHMAASRMIKNPMEEKNVKGITNYLDLGLQITSSLVRDGSVENRNLAAQDSSLRLAAAWQINKNWLLKARVGSDAVGAAVAFKAWWQPSMTASLAGVYDFATQLPRFGVTLNLENYGNIRYERSEGGIRTGKALVQRHVALATELANEQGEGILVREKDLKNKTLMGQTKARSSDYL